MCVALDYAKAKHSVLICNGLGDRLKSDFAVDNTAEGAAQLLTVVRACLKQRKMRPEHAFFGGEDQPSYAENFLRKLRLRRPDLYRVSEGSAERK